MMNRATYVLVNTLTVILIVALIGAPLWDSWYYHGVRSRLGPRVPLGVILPPPRYQPVLASMAGAPPASVAGHGGALSSPWPRADQLASWTRASYTTGIAAESLSTAANGRAGDAENEPTTAAGPSEGQSAGQANGVPPSPETGWLARSPAQDRQAPARGPERSPDGSAPSPAEPAGSDPGTASPGNPGALWDLWPTGATTQAPMPPPTQPPDGEPPAPPSHVLPPPAKPGDPVPNAETSPEVTLALGQAALSVGDTLTVAVNLASAHGVTSLPFHLLFDPEILEYLDGGTGAALGSNLQPVLLASVSPNRPGDLAVGLSLIESAGTFSGSGEVVTLRFRAIAPGDSVLQFSRASVRGATSQALSAKFTNSSVTVH
jgi:hypothetical protein